MEREIRGENEVVVENLGNTGEFVSVELNGGAGQEALALVGAAQRTGVHLDNVLSGDGGEGMVVRAIRVLDVLNVRTHHPPNKDGQENEDSSPKALVGIDLHEWLLLYSGCFLGR